MLVEKPRPAKGICQSAFSLLASASSRISSTSPVNICLTQTASPVKSAGRFCPFGLLGFPQTLKTADRILELLYQASALPYLDGVLRHGRRVLYRHEELVAQFPQFSENVHRALVGLFDLSSQRRQITARRP